MKRVKKADVSELDQASELAHQLNQKPQWRCRPFALGASLAKIKMDYKAYIEEENKELLLLYQEEKLIGVTGIFWMPEDKYLSITRGIFALEDFDQVSKAFVDYLVTAFPGYKLYINTAKEHKQSISFYRSVGFTLLEDAVLYHVKDYPERPMPKEVVPLGPNNEAAVFRVLEEMMTPDTYWNVERLQANRDKFTILAYEDQEVREGLYAQHYPNNTVEVFGMTGKNLQRKRKLLEGLMVVCKTLGVTELMHYTEEEAEVRLVKELGFSYKDSNVCLLFQIPEGEGAI